MHRVSGLLLAVSVVIGCASTDVGTDEVPPFVGSTRIEGRVYPQGESGGSHFDLSDRAAFESYGYVPEDPIKVGGGSPRRGPESEILFLNALLGPEGQAIRYRRLGSCCGFATPNYALGVGLLDVYEVTYDGLEEPVILYLNMYDPGELLIPHGFTARRR